MKGANDQVNRNTQNQQPRKEDQTVPIDQKQRKRANKEIDALLQRFHGRKSILQILPAMKNHGFPRYVIDVAIERVQRRLKNDDFAGQSELVAFKKSLEETK